MRRPEPLLQKCLYYLLGTSRTLNLASLSFLPFGGSLLKCFFNYSAAVPPVVICVKLDLTGGNLEQFLIQKNWREGDDYFHFS